MRRGGVTTSFESKPMASYSVTDRSRDGESRPRREVSRAGRAASAVAFVSQTRASSCRRPKSMATLAACAGESVLLCPSSGRVRRRAVASRAVERCGSREGNRRRRGTIATKRSAPRRAAPTRLHGDDDALREHHDGRRRLRVARQLHLSGEDTISVCVMSSLVYLRLARQLVLSE